jgi:carboxypeptidase Taq
MTAYDRLATRFARIATVGEAIGMLSWDASVMMPPGGAAARGDQLAVLSGLVHEMTTAPALADDLAAAEQAQVAGPWAAANLGLMRHRYLQSVALPADLVEASTRSAAGPIPPARLSGGWRVRPRISPLSAPRWRRSSV